MSAVLLVNGTPRAVTIGVTGPQGPPGPAVTPGTAGQFAVTNAAATALTWTSNLVSSTGLVTVDPSVSLYQKLGGTVGAPQDANTLVVQPTDTTKAAFGWHVGASLFNSTWDYVSTFGYNSNGVATTEPTQTLNFEQDYEVTPGSHVMETYFQFTTPASPGPITTYRPFFANYDRSAHTGSIVIGDSSKTTAASILTSGVVTLNGAYVSSFSDYRWDTSISTGSLTTQKAGAVLRLKYDNQVDRLLLDSSGVTILGTPWALQPDTGQVLTIQNNVVSNVVAYFKSANASGLPMTSYVQSTGLIGGTIGWNPSGSVISGGPGLFFQSYNNGGTATPFLFYNSSSALVASITGSHGVLQAGGLTGEFKAIVGPFPTLETTDGALYFLAAATATSTTNYAVRGDGSNTYLNAPAANVNVQVAGTTYQQVTSALSYFGGTGATAPVNIDWSSSTTPAVVSGTSATSLTVGTNKSGATTALTTGALLGAVTLDNPSGSLTKFKTTGQFFDHQVSKATNYTIDSAGAGDTQIVVTAACTITLPDPTISAGRRIEIVVAYNAAVGNYTIARNGTEKINGVASNLTCADALGNIRFIRCDGTDWYSKAAST